MTPPARLASARPCDGAAPVGLRRLNEATEADAVSLLASCCGSEHWSARVARHRPYPTSEAARAAAEEAFLDLAEADLAAAMADERCGEPGSVPTALAALVDPAHPTWVPGADAARIALREAHGNYEARFGVPFLLCLDEYPPEEALDQVLAALRVRLANDAETERAIATAELLKLVLSRLGRLLAAA